jgi:hypothetical protein
MSNVTVGTVRKSIAIVPTRWLRRKVFRSATADGEAARDAWAWT